MLGNTFIACFFGSIKPPHLRIAMSPTKHSQDALGTLVHLHSTIGYQDRLRLHHRILARTLIGSSAKQSKTWLAGLWRFVRNFMKNNAPLMRGAAFRNRSEEHTSEL